MGLLGPSARMVARKAESRIDRLPYAEMRAGYFAVSASPSTSTNSLPSSAMRA